jgi:hypothetical protein
MITIADCTPSDYATVAGFWNHMAGIAESCWYQAAPVTSEAIAAYHAAGLHFALALDAGVPVGFGFWRPVADRLQLNALAGETSEVYYSLMVAYADWGLAHEMSEGWAEIRPAVTRESGWMGALAVVTSEPIGHEPLAPGQDPAMRVVEWLRVTCSLAELRAAAVAQLGGVS